MLRTIEVLVACVQQDALKLYKEMNLQTDAVIANQCDINQYDEFNIDGMRLKVVSTAGRGVGKNRNYALLNATADILMIADEDMVYKNGYPQKTIDAFSSIKDADVIIFDLNYLNRFTKGRGKIKKIHRVRVYNSLRYGAARIAIKREALQKANIWFSVLYGGGAPYSCGEDALFIREALQKNLRIYAFPYDIADVKQEKSSWFQGYTEKYFIDRGVWLANAFPKMKYLLGLYYGWQLRDTTKEFSTMQIVKMILKGIRSFKELKVKT